MSKSKFDSARCLAAVNKLSDKIKDRVSGTIYHYTTAKGFEGIVKSKEIWMTNALFVNDKTELRASFEADDIFKDIQFNNSEFNVFKDKQDKGGIEDVEDYYLASFSKVGHSLDQFRTYGNYCIGFDSKRLRKYGFDLFRCVYKNDSIKKWIINKDKFPEWQNESFDTAIGASGKHFAVGIVESALSAKLKNKHYRSEKEIRMLVVSNSSWSWYRNSPEMFCHEPAIYFRPHAILPCSVPYVKFFIPTRPKLIEEFAKKVKGKSRIEAKRIIKKMEEEQNKGLLPITEVRIGPTQYQEEIVNSTKILLLENGYEKVKVTSSDIPYRGF